MWSVQSAASGLVIETEGLSKRYGAVQALDGVDLGLPAGAIGLLGPNGAGKTTLIQCLLQLQPISGGVARLLGQDVQRRGREIRRRVGYAPEQDSHIPGMIGCQHVTYCAQLCGLPFEAARQRAHEMLDFVGMGQERYRRIETYSTGMKQRLKLAQAIVHDPEIVFLDEPTNGLDPQGRVQTLDLVRSLWRDHGMAVVFSSHLLHDVDQVCDRIVIIARGRVLVHDTLEHLKSRRRGAAELVVTRGQPEVLAACGQRGWPCERLPTGRLKVEHRGVDLNELLAVLRTIGVTPIEVIPSPNALEETFVQALSTAHEPKPH